VKILVEVFEPTSVIKMNAAELEFTNAKIGEQEGVCAADSETETVAITTAAPLEIGKHTIEINYVGIHNDDMKGFYRTKSTNKDGVDEYSLVTQFEGQGPQVTVI
jgi:aminopeptidase N